MAMGDGLRILNQVSLEESGPVLNAPYGAWYYLTVRQVEYAVEKWQRS